MQCQINMKSYDLRLKYSGFNWSFDFVHKSSDGAKSELVAFGGHAAQKL